MTKAPGGFWPRLGRGARRGAIKALKQVSWLLAIMIPISLAVTLLSWTGILELIARPMAPAFKLVGLPPETCLAFVTGISLNVYSAIAALGAVQLSVKQVTVFALAALISHNFFIELAVQRKMGIRVWAMSLVRLGGSVLGVVVLHLLMPENSQAAGTGLTTDMPETFGQIMANWSLGALLLSVKILILVVGLMVLQELLEEFGILRWLARILAPLMWLMGLPSRVAFLWVAANTLGLAYGAAVFVEQIESGRLRKQDARLLNCSVGICHSLLEDSLLFVAVGASALWITVPRIVMAATAVWIFRGIAALLGKDKGQPGKTVTGV